MASQLKVEQYWVAAEMDEQYRMATTGVLTQLAANCIDNGDLDSALFATVIGEAQARVHRTVVLYAKQFYACFLSDDEMDQLISFARSPLAQKMRELVPVANRELLALFTNGTIDVPKVIDEIMADIEKGAVILDRVLSEVLDKSETETATS